MKHYTSIEQSKKLLELGLDPETADMYFSLWEEDPDFKELYMMESAPSEWKEITVYDRALPCWSLGALLELMPNFIVSHDTAFEDEDAEGISTTYYKHLEINKKSIWECSYKENGILSRFKADTPIEAAYSMVIWLLENGYIKKETKDL